MRRLLIILTLALSSQLLVAQVEWAPIGAVWYYSFPGSTNNPYADYIRYVSTKDTVVNGKTARVIASDRDTIIMHEDNGRVYYLFNDRFRLIYDFSAAVGDTVVFEFKAPKRDSFGYDTTYKVAYEVVGITFIENVVGGAIRKFSTSIVEVDTLEYESFDYLVLGMGSQYHYFERFGSRYYFMYTLNHPSAGLGNQLRCYMDSEIEYRTEWWRYEGKPCDYNMLSTARSYALPLEISLYPNPVLNTFNIITNGTIELGGLIISIYNHAGVRVLSHRLDVANLTLDVSHLPPGLYLVSFNINGNASKSKKILKL